MNDLADRAELAGWDPGQRQAYRLSVQEMIKQLSEYARPTTTQRAQLAAYQADLKILDDLGREDIRAAVTSGAVGYAVEAGTPDWSGDGAAARPGAGRTLHVRADQTLTQWGRAAGLPGLDRAEPLGFGSILRGLATGDWRGAEAEQRAISESPASAGGHMVPTPVALDVIDRARNTARVLAAGATLVPMTSATLKYPRLLTEGTPSWRNEAAAISDTPLTFDTVILTAQSLAILIKVSWELLEDAPPGSDVVTNSFAAQMSLELDRVALRGSGTAPEPRGVRNQSGVTITSFGGANGAAPTQYDHLLDAVQVLRAANFEPTGIIQSPRSETTLAKIKEATTNSYLQPPPQLASIPRYTTNQIPGNIVVGTSTDTTEVYIAQWPLLLVGMRTAFRVRVLEERFADSGQVAFLANLRADIQVAQPAAFNVITGIRP